MPKVLAVTPEGQQIRCEITNVNPDPSKTRLYYQTRDQIWPSLQECRQRSARHLLHPRPSRHQWHDSGKHCDLAGNTTTREFNLATLPVSNAALPAVTKNTANTLLLESSHDEDFDAASVARRSRPHPVSSNSTVLVTEQTIPSLGAEVYRQQNSNALVTAGHGPGVVLPKTPFATSSGSDSHGVREASALQCDVPGRVARQAAHCQQSACVS